MQTRLIARPVAACAANVGTALGSYAGGVAIGTSTASSAVITGLIIAATSIPAAWATSFLKPPVIADATEPAVAADVARELA